MSRRRLGSAFPGAAALAAVVGLGSAGCSGGSRALPSRAEPEPIERDDIEAVAREAIDAAVRIRGLPLDPLPAVRILPPGAFAIERDAFSGAAASGPEGDDYLLGLRDLAGLGAIPPWEVSTRGAWGDPAQIGNYDCEGDVVRVADLRLLPPPPCATCGEDDGAVGWLEMRASLRASLVHEVVHAIVRRAFPMACPPPRFWPDRDGVLAERAFEEGDADAALAVSLEETLAAGAAEVALWTAPVAGPGAGSPATGFDYLSRLMYAEGDAFARAVKRAGGNEALDAAHRHPPVSTEQIMHPERYFAGDLPALVAQPDLAELRSAGYALSDDGVVGEAGIVALLSAPALDAGGDVVGLPGEVCDGPPVGCPGIPELPGVRVVPPGMSLGLAITPPEVLATLPAEQRVEPAPPTEQWQLRDETGTVRPDAWRRILRAADGWHGDRIAFWLRADQRVPAVVWATAWDSECDAEHFRREILVARPRWGGCRVGRNVAVVGGLPPGLGRRALATVASGTGVEERAGAPFASAPVPAPGRVEEAEVADLGGRAPDGWSLPDDVRASPNGPTILRRFVDEDAGVVLPLPSGPFWQVDPVRLDAPLSRGAVLRRVGGGELAVATVSPAAAGLVEVQLAARLQAEGPPAELRCTPQTARSFVMPFTGDGTDGVFRAMLVDLPARTLYVGGWIPHGASPASLAEFDAAFEVRDRDGQVTVTCSMQQPSEQ